MRVNTNSNTISTNQPSFQNRVKQVSTSQEQASNGTAYRLDFSNWAMNLLESYDDEIQVINQDVLNYNKNLELTYKQKV